MCVARPLNGVEQVAILIGVLIAAQLLWRFVEKPFRAGSALPNAAAMPAIAAGCAAVVGLGLLLRADRASLWTLSAPARESVSQPRASKSRPACSMRVWRRDFERRQRLVPATLADVAAAGGALVLYPHTVLCDGATCAVADGVRPLDSDDDHLSAFGAQRVARALAPRLLKSLGLPVGTSGSP